MSSSENKVHIWDATTGEHLQTLSGHANAVQCLAFSPEGRTLASGSSDQTFRLWNTATWREFVTANYRHRQSYPVLDLFLARSHVRRGGDALAQNRPADALPELEKVRELLGRLLAEYPEPDWLVLQPSKMTSEGGADLALKEDGSILARGTHPDHDAYATEAVTRLEHITAIRLVRCHGVVR